MTVCSLCQQNTIDLDYSAHVDTVWTALEALYNQPNVDVRGPVRRAYSALAMLRWDPPYGRLVGTPANLQVWTHRGCYEDWAHDQRKHAEFADPDVGDQDAAPPADYPPYDNEADREQHAELLHDMAHDDLGLPPDIDLLPYPF